MPSLGLRIKGLHRRGLGPIDLQAEPGECVSLEGPSGSGKTLFLRAVADLDPAEGLISLDGVERNHMPAPVWRRKVGYLPPESGWWADRVGAHFDGLERAHPLLQRLDLSTEALDWEVTRLSTGERQRLALARLLIGDPEVLLLDEPTSGLDQDNTRRVEGLLDERRAGGAIIIFVTHDPAQADRIAQSRLRLRDGILLGDQV